MKTIKYLAAIILFVAVNTVKAAPADPDQNMATSSKPDLPLKPELVPAIVDFINKLK